MDREGQELKDGGDGQTPRYLKTLEEIERECKPGLVNVLREE